jgi:hypothetical protein
MVVKEIIALTMVIVIVMTMVLIVIVSQVINIKVTLKQTLTLIKLKIINIYLQT